jgi:hypothetical protein
LTRSDEEKSQLRSEAIPLTSDDLASYIGLYKESDSEVQIRMERTGNQLRVVASRSRWTQEYYTAELVPTARNHFENLDIKVSYDFTLESGSATQLKAKVGQLTIDYIKTD